MGQLVIMHELRKEILKILAVLSTCTVITKQRILIFLFSYSWSFGILLWEMATMGKLNIILLDYFFLYF